jgi:hypothetical protein
MGNTKQYSWVEWVSIPQNKELYQKDQLSALKLFQLEVVRRGDMKKQEEKKNV